MHRQSRIAQMMLLYAILFGIVLLVTVCQADSSSSSSSSDEDEASTPSSSDAMSVIKGLADSSDGSDLYELIACIGYGLSGRVYKARLKKDLKFLDIEGGTAVSNGKRVEKSGAASDDIVYSQQLVAVKVIPLLEEDLEVIAHELRILTRLGKHKNVIRLLSAHVHRGDDHWAAINDEGNGSSDGSNESEKAMASCSEYLWVASEWIQGYNLGFYIDSHVKTIRRGLEPATPAFSLSDTRHIAHGLVAGLSHFHSRGCTHGDVDISNVMISDMTAIFVDPGNGEIDNGEDEMGLDTLSLVVIIVEMSMVPQQYDTVDEGSGSMNQFEALKAESVPALLMSVAEGNYKVPEEVRQFVEFALKNVGKTTHCSVFASHSFLKQY